MAVDPVGPAAMAAVATSAEAVVVDPRVLALREEFHDVFTEPAGLPPVRELAHHIDLVDESAPAPRLCQFCTRKKNRQLVTALTLTSRKGRFVPQLVILVT